MLSIKLWLIADIYDYENYMTPMGGLGGISKFFEFFIGYRGYNFLWLNPKNPVFGLNLAKFSCQLWLKPKNPFKNLKIYFACRMGGPASPTGGIYQKKLLIGVFWLYPLANFWLIVTTDKPCKSIRFGETVQYHRNDQAHISLLVI